MSLKLRRGTNAERLTITPLLGEPIWTTDTKRMYIGDGITVGGVAVGSSLGLNQYECGETIPAHRVVVLVSNTVMLFQPTNSSHYNKVIGVSVQSGVITDIIEVVTNSEYYLRIGLTDGAIYFGSANGVLTTTPPTTGIVQPIGLAYNDYLNVDLKSAILKA